MIFLVFVVAFAVLVVVLDGLAVVELVVAKRLVVAVV